MKFNLSEDVGDLVVAMEELSELTKEISKALRDKLNIENMTEEIADVEIVVDKLKNKFNISDKDIEKWKEYKKSRINR